MAPKGSPNLETCWFNISDLVSSGQGGMGSLETSDLDSIEHKTEVLLFGSYIHLRGAQVAQKKPLSPHVTVFW